MQKLKKFQLHWLHGEPETVEGTDIVDACNRAGIGNGAIRALDYYEEVKEGSNSRSALPSTATS